jgi:hypothetical protein
LKSGEVQTKNFLFSLAELHILAGSKAAGCEDNSDTSSAERLAAKRNAKKERKISKKFRVSRGEGGGAKQQLQTIMGLSALRTTAQSK